MATKKVEEQPIEEQPEEQPIEDPMDILEPREDDDYAMAQYRAFLRNYKMLNPEKYEQKKEAFAKKLAGNIKIQENKANNRKTFLFN
jgi:hypothetical protein